MLLVYRGGLPVRVATGMAIAGVLLVLLYFPTGWDAARYFGVALLATATVDVLLLRLEVGMNRNS